MVNDGVVDSSKSNDQGVLHLVSANQQESKPRYQDRPKGERWDFATFGESYDKILTKLIAHNLVCPFDPTKLCIPEVKPWFHFLTLKTPWKQSHKVQVFVMKFKAHGIKLTHMITWIPIPIILVILGDLNLSRKVFHINTLIKRVRKNKIKWEGTLRCHELVHRTLHLIKPFLQRWILPPNCFVNIIVVGNFSALIN